MYTYSESCSTGNDTRSEAHYQRFDLPLQFANLACPRFPLTYGVVAKIDLPLCVRLTCL